MNMRGHGKLPGGRKAGEIKDTLAASFGVRPFAPVRRRPALSTAVAPPPATASKIPWTILPGPAAGDAIQLARVPFKAAGKPSDKETLELETIAAQVDGFVEQAAAEFGRGEFNGWHGERLNQFFDPRTKGSLLATWAGNAIEERVYQLMTAAGIAFSIRSAILGGVTLPDIVISLSGAREAFIDITSDLQQGHIGGKAGGRWTTESRVVFVEESVYGSFTVEQLTAIQSGGIAAGYQVRRDEEYYRKREADLSARREKETEQRRRARTFITEKGFDAYVTEMFDGKEEKARAYLRSIKMPKIRGQYEPKKKHMAKYSQPQAAVHKRKAEKRRQARRASQQSEPQRKLDAWSRSARSRELRLQTKENERLHQLELQGDSPESKHYLAALEEIATAREARSQELQKTLAAKKIEIEEAQTKEEAEIPDEVGSGEEDLDDEEEEEVSDDDLGLGLGEPGAGPFVAQKIEGHEGDYGEHFIDDGQILRIHEIDYRVGAVPNDGACLFETVVRLRHLDASAGQLRAYTAEYEEAGTGDVFGDAEHVYALKAGAWGTVREDLAAIAELHPGTYVVHVFTYQAGEVDVQTKGSGEPTVHLLLQAGHFRPLEIK